MRSKLLIITGLLVITAVTGLCLSARDKTPKLKLDTTLRQTYRSPLLFEILGYINDKRGRVIYIGHNDRIAHFYMSEKKAADEFEILLNHLKQDYKLETEITREEDENFIDFYPDEIADIINSCYTTYYKSGIITSDFDESIETVGYICGIDMAFFENLSEEEMISFLKGAHSRYGNKNAFINPSREHLIINYLTALECYDIKIMNLASNIPNTYVIVFDPSKKTQEALNITSFYNIVVEEGNPTDDSFPNSFETSNEFSEEK